MSIGLVLLANGATSNEVFYKCGEAWPPEVPFQDNVHTKNSHVSQERGGMD